jgi:hypothetical protein
VAALLRPMTLAFVLAVAMAGHPDTINFTSFVHR